MLVKGVNGVCRSKTWKIRHQTNHLIFLWSHWEMLLNSEIIFGQYSSRDIVISSKTGVNHYFVPKWDLLWFTVEIVAVTIWMDKSPGIAWRHFFISESCWLKCLPLLPAFFKMYYPRLQNIVSITAHKRRCTSSYELLPKWDKILQITCM